MEIETKINLSFILVSQNNFGDNFEHNNLLIAQKIFFIVTNIENFFEEINKRLVNESNNKNISIYHHFTSDAIGNNVKVKNAIENKIEAIVIPFGTNCRIKPDEIKRALEEILYQKSSYLIEAIKKFNLIEKEIYNLNNLNKLVNHAQGNYAYNISIEDLNNQTQNIEIKINCEENDFKIEYLNVEKLFKKDIIKDQEPLNLNYSFNKPIIFTSIYNILDPNIEIYKYIDPRYKFFDSSIWCRFIQLEELMKSGVIKDILKYIPRTQAVSAKEFINFNKRQYDNSFITKMEEVVGHSGHIAPFTFHSEFIFKNEAKIDLEIIKKIPQLSWRILLIDDHSNQEMVNLGKTKKIIIEENLIDLIEFIKIEYAETIDKGLEYLQEKHFDVVLLDYLFIDQNFNVSFGYELLKDVLGEGRIHYDNIFHNEKFLGPTRKFWVFPISVYGNAMMDKLREIGITAYDDKWIISQGADPLNTPELFKYKLYSFLRRQIEEFSSIYKENGQYAIISDFYIIFMKCLLKSTQKDPSKLIESMGQSNLIIDNYNELKKNIFNYFSDFIEQGAKFRRLNKFKNESNFSSSIIKHFYFDFKYVDWDRFQNMIYYLAYGNLSNHSTIIKQEINFFKNKINNEHLNEYKNGELKLLKLFIDKLDDLSNI